MFDLDAVCDRWQAVAGSPAASVDLGDGTPLGELSRTPAASRVGALAARDGLFAFHYEHRLHLALSKAWVPDESPELADVPAWEDGVLPEPKYQSFRHDLQIASYHPHHRAKWAVHELCHGLVGFGWHRAATPFFHATAGRLAELLPVALWYFFDEAFLRRCPDHQGDGALFRRHCPACEAVAAPLAEDHDARRHVHEGVRFVERELAAIARSRRLGRPIPHRWATIDLASDGVAYAVAHGKRLESRRFAAYVERFCVNGGGWSASLDDLEARLVQVLGALLGTEPAPALAPSPAHGRCRWILQDVAWRLSQVAACAPPKARAPLDRLSEALAHACDATRDAQADPTAATVQALDLVADGLSHDARVAQEVLGVGYRLPAAAADAVARGAAALSLSEGLATALPLTVEVLDARLAEAVQDFVVQDTPQRLPLATRFAAWLSRAHGGALADLASWEATAATLPAAEEHTLTGPARGDRMRLDPRVRILRSRHDVLDLGERADSGGLQLGPGPGLELVAVDDRPLHAEEQTLLLRKEADGDLLVLDVDPASASALEALDTTGVLDLPADEIEALTEYRVLLPTSLAELDPGAPGGDARGP